MAFKYNRGLYVKDIVTGFKGCLVARTDSLTGCNRYLIQPEVDKDGKNVDAIWVDEHEIEIDTTRQQLRLTREAEQPPG